MPAGLPGPMLPAQRQTPEFPTRPREANALRPNSPGRTGYRASDDPRANAGPGERRDLSERRVSAHETGSRTNAGPD